MTGPATDTLPAELEQTVRDAFGAAPIENVQLLKGGLSGAVIYAIRVGDRDLVVRRGHPERAAREFACMRIAAELGVAPRLYHADEARGVSIMARIAHERAPHGPEHTARVARTLRRLHGGPAFAQESTLAGTLRWLDAGLRAGYGEGLPERLLAPVLELAEVMHAFAASAPCHVDLNPANILDDGHNIYLIDWEIAGMGDPYLDLAQLGVFLFPAPELRAALHEAYLERSPSEFERARMTLARVMALGMYAASFIWVTAVATGSARITAEPVSLREMGVMLGTQRERVSTAVVAASLLDAMEREYRSEMVAEARRLAAGGAGVCKDVVADAL